MPDDILDAAQKAVDDAAKTADTGVSPQTPSALSATTDLPPEPAPEPVAGTVPSPLTPPSPTLNEPEPQPQGSTEPPSEEATKLVESLLEPKNPEPSVVAPPPKNPTPPPIKKSSGKGVVLALLAILLIALPVGVFFISQQNQQIAEIRTQAGGTVYGGDGDACPCDNGYVCNTATQRCKPDSDPIDCKRSADPGAPVCCSKNKKCNNPVCEGKNRLECHDGSAWCTLDTGGCKGGGGDDTGGGDDDTSITPKCQLIKIYKGNTQVTDLKTLKAGDTVTLAVKGNRPGQKGRFRVNGGSWSETTTKNNKDEWTLNYTIATGVTDFVIEGEVYIRGAWR